MGDELPFPKAHVTGRGYGSLGEIDSGMSVNHVFDDSGDYVVEATISSNLWGCLSTESIDILINATPEIDIESDCSPGAAFVQASWKNNKA